MITWTAEQRAFRQAIIQRAEPLSAEHLDHDLTHTYPVAKWDLLRETGIMALPFDECWGGLGEGVLTTMHVLEALGEVCRDSGLAFSLTTTLASTGIALQRFGSDELKDNFLRRLCKGDLIGAHAITEAQGGSDALKMYTRAERVGDQWELNGAKGFVTNASIADTIMVYAKTRAEGGPLGVTAFLVDRCTPGLAVGPPISKMGLRTAPTSEVFLTDVRVPNERVVGRVGGGYMVLDFVMKYEILFSFIVNVGEMSHRFTRASEYARQREQFGAKIGSYQAVAKKLVDAKISLETCRKWLYDTGEKLERGEDVTFDVAVSKLLTSTANVQTGLDAIQIFGGYGYTTEYGLEKGLRDAVASTIYSGTNEIQYNRIASFLGLAR